MHDEEHDSGSYLAKSDPPLLFFMSFIPLAYRIRVFEDVLCRLEINPVFRQVLATFASVEFESQTSTSNSLGARSCASSVGSTGASVSNRL